MRVRVLFFGQLRDIIGRRDDFLELSPGAKVSEVMAYYAQQYPSFGPISSSLACSVNQEYVPGSTVLRENDEVGLLPPVSGGRKESGDSVIW